MSAFKFRLQQVLELREKQEMQTAAKLADAETAADEARVAKKALEAIQRGGSHALHAAHDTEPTIGQLKTMTYVMEQLNHHIAGAQTRVDTAEQLVTQARSDLNSALQARRVLTRLRDRHFATWQTEGNAQEMKQMDELALSRFSRRSDDDATGATST